MNLSTSTPRRWFASPLALGLCCALSLTRAAPAAVTPDDIGRAVAAAATYDDGQSSKPLAALEKIINETAGQPALRAEIEQQIARQLDGPAPLAAKQFFCRQLEVIGPDRAVKALAGMLATGDTHLTEMACLACNRHPNPDITAALRLALGNCKGTALVAVINLLGERRDAACEPNLIDLTKDSEAAVADAAIAALGKIATPAAVRALLEIRQGGDAARHVTASAACLQAAQQLEMTGKPEAARPLHAVLGDRTEPLQIRRGALLGKVRTAGDAASAIILETLRKDDPDLTATAIDCIRTLPGPEVDILFAAEITHLPANQQELLVTALTDRGNPSVVPALTQAAASPVPAVRIAALKGLGKLGGAASVALLLKVRTTAAADEAEVAAACLRGLQGDGVDAALLAAMQAASGDARVQLIRLLAERSARQAVPALLTEAANPDSNISAAARKALGQLAGAKELPDLIRLLANSRDDSDREQAEAALSAVVHRTAGQGGDLGPLWAALGSANNSPTHAALLRVAGGLANDPAYQAISACLRADDAIVRDAAIRLLAGWPDARALNQLLDIIKGSADDTQRVVALRGYLRLLGAVKQEPAAALEGYAAALAAAHRAEEKKLVLSGLATVPTPAALKLALSCLDDPATRAEAALALIAIGGKLGDQDSGSINDAMQRVIKVTQDAALLTQATALLRPTNAAPPALHDGDFMPLFDGKTFAGWEGDHAVFRIQDGAIVGGNLKTPLPRNEFLCTTRAYANFELRLKFKVLGAGVNAGIQLRSRRVPNNNEVSGYQADLGQGCWGNLYDESRRNRNVAQADQVEVARHIKAEDWNDYRMLCQGGRIQLWINGSPTVDFMETDGNLEQTGIIGLQIHAGGPSEAWYKDIMICPLPDK